MVEYNVNSKAPNLKLKHVRINVAFQKIKEKLKIDDTNNQAAHDDQIDEPLFDYFSTLMNEQEENSVNDNENGGNSAVGQKAKYCRYQQKQVNSRVEIAKQCLRIQFR